MLMCDVAGAKPMSASLISAGDLETPLAPAAARSIPKELASKRLKHLVGTVCNLDQATFATLRIAAKLEITDRMLSKTISVQVDSIDGSVMDKIVEILDYYCELRTRGNTPAAAVETIRQSPWKRLLKQKSSF